LNISLRAQEAPFVGPAGERSERDNSLLRLRAHALQFRPIAFLTKPSGRFRISFPSYLPDDRQAVPVSAGLSQFARALENVSLPFVSHDGTIARS
jgi:hypothetical protein